MHPDADSRIVAFEGFVVEARKLCSLIHQAEAGKAHADGHQSLPKSRLAAAKLQFQLHMSKGRPVKRAALYATRESVMEAVGGEALLGTHPLRRLARHYLDELRGVSAWPRHPSSPRQEIAHLGEVMQVIDRALGEAGVMRRAPQADCKL